MAERTRVRFSGLTDQRREEINDQLHGIGFTSAKREIPDHNQDMYRIHAHMPLVEISPESAPIPEAALVVPATGYEITSFYSPLGL